VYKYLSPTSSQTENQRLLKIVDVCSTRHDRERESTLLVITIKSHYYAQDFLWLVPRFPRCHCDLVGTRYFLLLRLIRLVFEWMLIIITADFLFSNADILFSLVGRVFHGDDWTI
jgi:hypothetical protein